MPRALLSHDSPPPGQLPHSELSTMSHGVEYPGFLASLGQLSWLCPLPASREINPIVTEPSTPRKGISDKK